METTRWKRVKRGKYGRVSILYKCSNVFNDDDIEWLVDYFYLDGEHKSREYGNLNVALESQKRFLRGERIR